MTSAIWLLVDHLARGEQTARVKIAATSSATCACSHTIDALEAEIAGLVAQFGAATAHRAGLPAS
jgi:hypothetical protein